MRQEPSAPEITELQVGVTPVYVYRAAPSTDADGVVVPSKILVGAWDTGFCSCLNFLIPNAFMALCCPWVSLAQITARLGLFPYTKTLLLVLVLHIGTWTAAAMGLAVYRRNHDHQGDTNEPFSPVTLRSGVRAWCFLSFLCTVVYIAVVWNIRTRVRDRFQINGSRAWDLLAAGCCTWCTVTQIATHIKSYTPGSCDLGPPADVLPPYP